MSDGIKIETKGTKEKIKNLDNISKKRLKAWVQFSLGKESDEFVDYVKEYWLSGKINGIGLNKITGETQKSMGAWIVTKKRKSSKYGVGVWARPGIGVPGMLNYLEKWVGMKHEFVQPAFEAFNSNNRIIAAVQDNMSKQFDKVVRNEE